jgi:hypothetical protein
VATPEKLSVYVVIWISFLPAYQFRWTGTAKLTVSAEILSQWHAKKCGASGIVVVKALCHKTEGRVFETRRGELIFFNLPNPSDRTRPWHLLSYNYITNVLLLPDSVVTQESGSLSHNAMTPQQILCYRSGRPKCSCSTKRHRTMYFHPTKRQIARCPRCPIKSNPYKRALVAERMTVLKNTSEERRIDKTSSYDQSRNYRLSVRHQLRCSFIVLHREVEGIFPFYIAFLRKVASLIDSLVTRGALTKNSEWLCRGDQVHRDTPYSKTKRLGGGGDTFLARWPEAPSLWEKTYTSSWQHHVLPTSWIASPHIHLSLLKTFFMYKI